MYAPQEVLLGVIPPEPKHVTQPATPRYDPDLQAVKHMASEEVSVWHDVLTAGLVNLAARSILG